MRSKLLPGISSGETLMTLAVTEEGGGYGPEGVQLEAKRRGDEYTLSPAASSSCPTPTSPTTPSWLREPPRAQTPGRE